MRIPTYLYILILIVYFCSCILYWKYDFFNGVQIKTGLNVSDLVTRNGLTETKNRERPRN